MSNELSTHVKPLKDVDFDAAIQSKQPVLVDFFATWCGPCKMLAPVLEELAGEMEGQAAIYSLDVDENAIASQKYGIRSVPTLIIFKNGEAVETIVGSRTKKELQDKLTAQR